MGVFNFQFLNFVFLVRVESEFDVNEFYEKTGPIPVFCPSPNGPEINTLSKFWDNPLFQRPPVCIKSGLQTKFSLSRTHLHTRGFSQSILTGYQNWDMKNPSYGGTDELHRIDSCRDLFYIKPFYLSSPFHLDLRDFDNLFPCIFIYVEYYNKR